MDIKGTAIIAIRDFVKISYPDDFQKWLNALPDSSKQIFSGVIDATKWYDVKDAAIEPTKQIAELFFSGDLKQGAWESGKFSADKALKGIYKIFVKASSPQYIISRASRVFASYYQPCEMIIDKNISHDLTLHIINTTEMVDVIEYRIAGWIEKALEISGSKNINIQITRAISNGDELTEYSIKWE